MQQTRGATIDKVLMIGVLMLLAFIVGASMLSFMRRAQTPGAPDTGASQQILKPNPESEAEQTTPRLLFAQVVDEEPKDIFLERAIIEGKTFKHVLKQAALKKSTELIAATDDKVLFENLLDEADLHRGKPYTPGRGGCVEISRVELDPSYGFPPGWTVLPGIFINTATEVYAVRFICPPGSTLYDKLAKGIADDSLPVMNLSGIFFKNYARSTSDPAQKPWVKPLLICPEPDFVKDAEPRQVLKELNDAGFGNLLPSVRIDAPGAEERLVIEISTKNADVLYRVFGEAASKPEEFVPAAVNKFIKRLPEDHAKDPSAVLLLRAVAPSSPQVKAVESALKGAGVKRVYIKQDLSK